MLTYNMDVTPESVWKRTTPSEAELAQPYYCTEAGVFYAQQHFSTARTDKESYLLFYTLRGAGLIEQGESHVVLGTGQALLLNCRTPQSYCTAPGQSCWHHYWVHLDGAGVAAMEPLLLPGKKLTPVQLTGVKMQELFEMLLGQMEHSTVDSMVTTGLALHEMLALCARSILAEAETTSARQVILQAVETLDNQREESIEGQIRECTAYAEKNGITIVKHYIDRAISAKTDNRPEFQQMIKEMTEVYPLRGDVPRSFLFFGCLCRYHAVLVGADGVCIDGVALGGVGQDAEGVAGVQDAAGLLGTPAHLVDVGLLNDLHIGDFIGKVAPVGLQMNCLLYTSPSPRD